MHRVVLLAFLVIWFVGCDEVVIQPVRKTGGTQVVVKEGEKPTIVPLTNLNITEKKEYYIDQNGNGNGNGGQLNVSTSNGGFGEEDSRRNKKIPLVFKITTDYPGGITAPKSILLDNYEVQTEDVFRPGTFSMRIAKPGYEIIQEDITIPENRTQFTIERQLISKPRVVRFEFTDHESNERLGDVDVQFNGRALKDGGKVKPGKYQIKIAKKDYQPINDNIIIPVSEKPYLLKRKMGRDAVPTVLNWLTTGTYPPGEEIVVETVSLDGKEVEQDVQVDSGSHQITFKDPRYELLSQNVNVPKGVPSHTVKAVLTPKPRKVELYVQYDVEPGPDLGATTAALTSISGQTIPLKSGMDVNPGQYELLIEKRGYSAVTKTVRIYPGTSVYEIRETMESLPVKLQANIAFDIEPPTNLKPYVVTFIDQERQFRISVGQGGSIKPGTYDYFVEKEGYLMEGNKKQISIVPSEKPVNIRERMVAQPRRLSFNFQDGDKLITPSEVLINNKKVSFEDRFKPGQSYYLVAKFNGYQTVQQQITVVPGAQDQVVSADLKR